MAKSPENSSVKNELTIMPSVEDIIVDRRSIKKYDALTFVSASMVATTACLPLDLRSLFQTLNRSRPTLSIPYIFRVIMINGALAAVNGLTLSATYHGGTLLSPYLCENTAQMFSGAMVATGMGVLTPSNHFKQLIQQGYPVKQATTIMKQVSDGSFRKLYLQGGVFAGISCGMWNYGVSLPTYNFLKKHVEENIVKADLHPVQSGMLAIPSYFATSLPGFMMHSFAAKKRELLTNSKLNTLDSIQLLLKHGWVPCRGYNSAVVSLSLKMAIIQCIIEFIEKDAARPASTSSSSMVQKHKPAETVIVEEKPKLLGTYFSWMRTKPTINSSATQSKTSHSSRICGLPAR